MNNFKTLILALGLSIFTFSEARTQDSTAVEATEKDSTRPEMSLTVGYFMQDNKLIYLLVNTKAKIDKKFQPVKNTAVRLYLDKEEDSSFIGKVTTDKNGLAKAMIPVSLQSEWTASPVHTVLGIAEKSKDFEEATSETAITRTKISLDTATSDEGKKTITVQVLAQTADDWKPAADVEMRVGIKRLGSILSAGDEATDTTDSTGSVTVELTKDSLPGDIKGNYILVARVDDSDPYGNLTVEKLVPWGRPLIVDKNFFDQRTLWSTRFKSPLWLLFIACSIVIGVWGTIIYLVIQIVKIKKIGVKVQV